MTAERYHAKRDAGIPDLRYDGSRCSPDTDEQAAAAERFAAHALGGDYNETVYADRGDDGHDFTTSDGRTVEVVWLGAHDDGSPRRRGHLIVNPEEPHRWADLYVVVAGSTRTGFWLVGWTGHDALTGLPTKDFGYGAKYAMPTGQLAPFCYTTIDGQPRAITVRGGLT